MKTRPPVLSQDETINLLLRRSKRPKEAVPIRTSFLQQGPQDKPKPGPLADIVSRGDGRALDLFLLAHAVTSGGDHSVTEWSHTWARSLGQFDDSSGPTAVSRVWKRLEDQKLVRRERGEGGKARVFVLREDGSGVQYAHPFGERRIDPYFQIPYEYWTDDERWHGNLRLPAKAMLLIGLSNTKSTFQLPHERIPDWYGISADTGGRGIRSLQDAGLLEIAGVEYIPTLKSKTGYAERNLYRLLRPFDLKRRGMGHKRRPA